MKLSINFETAPEETSTYIQATKDVALAGKELGKHISTDIFTLFGKIVDVVGTVVKHESEAAPTKALHRLLIDLQNSSDNTYKISTEYQGEKLTVEKQPESEKEKAE